MRNSKIFEKIRRIPNNLLRGLRTAFGFQLPQRILSKLDYRDPNKSRLLILNTKKNGSHDYYEIKENGNIIRKHRIFDNNGNYVITKISFYDRNGCELRRTKTEKEEPLEVKRDSLIFPEIPKDIRRKLTQPFYSMKYIDTNLVASFTDFGYNPEITILRTGNTFEQKVKYNLDKGGISALVDVAYFDEKGRQIKVVKSFAVIRQRTM